ncbi:LemA family protein, partial [bacterium]|nr:LemA family protein [bacterium]MDA7610660.1 LemA family protein [bacterium]
MWGILIGVVIVLLVVVIIYNGFISRRNAMRHAFSSIDIQLKKRWDLIPNLVESVKGYATHE